TFKCLIPMLIKNLSRKGGGSAPVLKYIFRYVFRETAPVRKNTSQSRVYSPDRQRQRIGYVRALRGAGVKFTRKDIDYLIKEDIEAKLHKDFIARTGGKDAVRYIQL